jgi:pyruvate,orthophosphate dikinase
LAIMSRIYMIGGKGAPPPAALLESAGNKAFHLMWLAALGFPVPPGFVLSTGFCRDWIEAGGCRAEDLAPQLLSQLRQVENQSGLIFGDRARPLLLAVRSGAAASMPGMLDTLLNIGLSERTIAGFIAVTGNPRLAWDSYRRLIAAFAETVHGQAGEPFGAMLSGALAKAQAHSPAELDSLELRALARGYLELFADLTGEPFPQAPEEQLVSAVEAVFRSWQSPRAAAYRRLHGLDGKAGTAVTVQRMVFGNAGSNSGAGVGFTRDPASGENRLYLDFALNAQGEDVVSGRQMLASADRLERLMPGLYAEVVQIAHRLERAFGDAQDFEFTIEEGRFYLLQTRQAKRSAWAALRIAIALAEEGIISPQEALGRVDGMDLGHLVRRRLAKPAEPPLASAVSASLGAASGRIALSSEAAQRMAGDPAGVLLLRMDMSTDDVAGAAVAQGILTARGGRTSHAAVVARQLDRVCLVGCAALHIAPDGRNCRIGERELAEGDLLTLDGDSGAVYAGRIETTEERPEAELAKLAQWRREPAPAGACSPALSKTASG